MCEEFIGEPRPASAHQAEGKFVKFYDEYEEALNKMKKENKIDENFLEQEAEVETTY